MPKSIDAGDRVKARKQAFRNQGLCSCGNTRRAGISARTKKPYETCQRCSQRTSTRNAQEWEEKKDAAGAIDHGVPSPITTTGLHYQVLRSGVVGVVVPSPCPDPLVLEFRDGSRDAFHLRELEPTALSVSRSKNSIQEKQG